MTDALKVWILVFQLETGNNTSGTAQSNIAMESRDSCVIAYNQLAESGRRALCINTATGQIIPERKRPDVQVK